MKTMKDKTIIRIEDKYANYTILRKFIQDIDSTFRDGGTIISKNNRNTIKRYLVNKHGNKLFDIVVKQSRPKSFYHKIIYGIFAKSKSRRSYENAHILVAAGCVTPEPISFVEIRHGYLLQSCYYISAYTDAVSVRTELEEKANYQLANSFAHFIAHLHNNGIVHHDLNLSNVLYNKTDNKYEISVIDINRMTHRKAKNLNILQCYDDFVRWTDNKNLYIFVMEEYAYTRGIPVHEFIRQSLVIKRIHNFIWKIRHII